jgi:hypothetical protein
VHQSPIASATLVQAAKSMDARNIRARRTAVITDFSLTRSWDFFLERRKPFARFLVPAGIHYASIGSGRNAAKGPAANGPSKIRLEDIFSIACHAPFLVYIIPELIRPSRVFRQIAVSAFGVSLGLASQDSDRP